MRKNENPGFLITFCGLDGCGKTTMMKRLIAELETEHNLFVTKQPTNAVRNSEIFRTYMDCPDHGAFDYRSLSLLAASDRLQHVNKVIEPEMKQGKIILSDRYFYSCLANLRARGFEEDAWIYEIAESVVKPDIAFFFDVPVEEDGGGLMDSGSALLRFVEILRAEEFSCTRVDAFRPGYLLSVLVSGESPLTPVWRLETDGGILLINAENGRIESKNA